MKINKLKDSYKDYYRKNFGNDFSKSKVDRNLNSFYQKFKFIEKKIDIYPEMDILEIGSGFGALYQLLSENKVNYTGIEMDNEVVDFTKKYFGVNNFYCQSFEEFECKNKFDIIFAIEVLEHFVDPLNNIKKIRKLLNKNGVFVGTTPYPSKYSNLANDTHYYVLHPENWKKFFLMNDFKQVNVYPMSLIPYFWRISKYFSFNLPIYLPFDYLISTSLIIAKV